jgi:hypothetical protein
MRHHQSTPFIATLPQFAERGRRDGRKTTALRALIFLSPHGSHVAPPRMSLRMSDDYMLPPNQQTRVERLEEDMRNMKAAFGDMHDAYHALVDMVRSLVYVVRAFAFVCVVAPNDAIADGSSRRSQTGALRCCDGGGTTVNRAVQ